MIASKKWKKIALSVFAVTQLWIFAACGSQDTTTTTGEELTIYGEVTKMSGSDITLALGTLNDMTQPQVPGSSDKNSESTIDNNSDNTTSSSGGSASDGASKPNGNPPSDATKPSGNPPDSGTKLSGNPPDGTAPSSTQNSTQTTDGTATDNTANNATNPGTGTSGSSPDGKIPPNMSQGGFSMLTLTGEEKTITVTDESIITASKDSTETGLASIQVGDTLRVKYKQNKDGSETLLSIKKVGGGGPKADTANPTIESTASYSQRGDSVTKSDETITATEENQSNVKVTDSGSLTLTNCGIITTGNSTSTEESDFYGLNAAVTAGEGSSITLNGCQISSSSGGRLTPAQ